MGEETKDSESRKEGKGRFHNRFVAEFGNDFGRFANKYKGDIGEEKLNLW